jgi:hypothetical protein
MAVELEIQPCGDCAEINFAEFKIRHANCGHAQGFESAIKRNPATDFYTLECQCGLRIEFPQLGEAQSVLTNCAIDQVKAVLPVESYSANYEGAVHVVAWEG